MAKRNNDHLSLSEVLKAFVETNKLDKGIDKIQVQNAWSDLMGPGVNNYTQEVTLKNDILYVQLSSSVLREELSYGKDKIVQMLNESLGKDVVKSIVSSLNILFNDYEFCTFRRYLKTEKYGLKA